MRQILTINEKEASIPTVLISVECQNSLKKLIKGEIKTIYDKYYRGEHNEIANELRDSYYHKCAYCEKPENKPQVEHYRPKSVYKWLAYEWTNLLPICADCNSVVNGKGDKFPLLSPENGKQNTGFELLYNSEGVAQRTYFQANGEYLLSESPVMLHPEIDNPFDFIRLNYDGTLSGIDEAGRGEQTIQICNMKERSDLVKSRVEIVDEVIKRIREAFDRLRESEWKNKAGLKRDFYRVFSALTEKAQINKPFSFTAQYILTHFSEMISSQLKEGIIYQKTVQTAFEKYQAGTLLPPQK